MVWCSLVLFAGWYVTELATKHCTVLVQPPSPPHHPPPPKKKKFYTHGKKSSVLIGQDSFVAYFASVYMDGVEYRALTRPS